MGIKRIVIGVILGAAVAACFAGPRADTQPTAPQPEWRAVKAENVLLFKLTEGTVAIELAPQFAPLHAERMRQAARAGVFDGEYFYRVIEGHVAQGGVEFDARMTDWPGLPLEAEWAPKDGFTPLGNEDLFAPEVGHTSGFAVGRGDGKEWLLHCPGAVAMARDMAPNTGTIEFYIPIGPRRYLDRNLTVFGRVIEGMDIIDGLERVPPSDEAEAKALLSNDPAISGPAATKRDAKLAANRIISARIAADLPQTRRPTYRAMETDSAWFADLKRRKRVRFDPDLPEEGQFWFKTTPAMLDICALERESRPLIVERVAN